MQVQVATANHQLCQAVRNELLGCEIPTIYLIRAIARWIWQSKLKQSTDNLALSSWPSFPQTYSDYSYAMHHFARRTFQLSLEVLCLSISRLPLEQDPDTLVQIRGTRTNT